MQFNIIECPNNGVISKNYDNWEDLMIFLRGEMEEDTPTFGYYWIDIDGNLNYLSHNTDYEEMFRSCKKFDQSIINIVHTNFLDYISSGTHYY
uniref:C-type lectin domain-containing protein n=1 Tax=Strongyloides stercoralis TaxID=6248 RepID=A0A0K0EAV9_STRER